MFIQTAQTPNPATLKFLPGQTVLENDTADFKQGDDVSASPLAQRLFALQGVVGVFFGSDFISVTKADDTEWVMLKPMVLTSVMEHFVAGHPVLIRAEKDEDTGDDDPIVHQIKELISERVRPAVQMDGGDIVFERFDESDGVVYLQLRGACSGCPSSTMTLKSGIENMLKHYVPEVTEVRAAGE